MSTFEQKIQTLTQKLNSTMLPATTLSTSIAKTGQSISMTQQKLQRYLKQLPAYYQKIIQTIHGLEQRLNRIANSNQVQFGNMMAQTQEHLKQIRITVDEKIQQSMKSNNKAQVQFQETINNINAQFNYNFKILKKKVQNQIQALQTVQLQQNQQRAWIQGDSKAYKQYYPKLELIQQNQKKKAEKMNQIQKKVKKRMSKMYQNISQQIAVDNTNTYNKYEKMKRLFALVIDASS